MKKWKNVKRKVFLMSIYLFLSLEKEKYEFRIEFNVSLKTNTVKTKRILSGQFKIQKYAIL